jgi:hypothetical protein
MGIRFSNIKLFLLGVAVAFTLPSEAQQGSQPILFSSPDNGSAADLKDVTGSSTPDLNDAFQAPSSFSVNGSGAAPSAPAIPAPSASEGDTLQQMLDNRKNWVFMTPAEILGVDTPEKILGIPDRNAFGQRQNLTAIERFAERQMQGGTKALQSGDSDSWWNSHNRNNSPNASLPNIISSDLGNSSPVMNMNSFVTAPKDSLFAGQSANAGQQKLSLPLQTSAIAQQTAMDPDPFKELLEPVQTPTPLPSATPVDHYLGNSSDPIFGPEKNDGAGASFTPLNSEIATPTGLTPLPGIAAQISTQPQTPPSWAPKPPPWLLQGPQLFEMPQRKF